MMKLYQLTCSAITLMCLAFASVGESHAKKEPEVNLGVSYTVSKVFNQPDVFQLLRARLKKKGFAFNSGFIDEADLETSLNKGNLTIGTRKGKTESEGPIALQFPVIVFYNKNKLGQKLNLTKAELKDLAQNTLRPEGTKAKFRHLDRSLKAVVGADIGHSRKALASVTGVPYRDGIRGAEADKEFVKKEDVRFIRRTLLDKDHDIALIPAALNKAFFKEVEDDKIGIATIEGLNYFDDGYELKDKLYFVNGQKQSEAQVKAMAEVLNDQNVIKLLGKYDIKPVSERNIEFAKDFESRPDIYSSAK